MAKIFIQKSISQRRMSKKQKAYEKSSGKCTLKPQQDTTTYPLGWLKLEQFKLQPLMAKTGATGIFIL